MGVIHMKMYGSIGGNDDVSEALWDDKLEPSSSGSHHRSHFSQCHRHLSSTKKFDDDHHRHHRRTSSHTCYTSEGRPPRHPDSRICKCVFNSPTTVLNTRDFDDFRNEKFPAEILANIKRDYTDIDGDCRILSNEVFRSLLGMGEPNDDVVLIEPYF
mmetsp:Transcript_30026/g.72510  ORF Transcript_30026/g.72510 Transcript_30026/m.72510 type:complete len:157 (-) Transcript_30026:1685-2155(-)